MKIEKIIGSCGKSGTFLGSAVLKARRDKDVAVVCEPQAFSGSLFMEREAQMSLLDSLLFRSKNAKKKRNLIVAVASSGMGKSAFVDEYSRWRLRKSANDDKLSDITHPIAITYNTDTFGGPIVEDD